MAQPNDGRVQGGLIIYDLTHHATHHFPIYRGFARYIKRYRMAQHYKNPDTRLGSVFLSATGYLGWQGRRSLHVKVSVISKSASEAIKASEVFVRNNI